MTKLYSLTSPRMKRWVACSIGIMLVMLFIGGGHAFASSLAHNSWASAAPMPTARGELAASLGSDGRIYAIGGEDLNTVEAYNSKTNSWTSVAPMPTTRETLAASLGVDGRTYAIGGFDSAGDPLNTVEAYTP